MDNIVLHINSFSFKEKENILTIIKDIKYLEHHHTISSGIGDILLTKLVNKGDIVYYNIAHLLYYKPYPDCYINLIFNYRLLKKLFEDRLIIYYNPIVIQHQLETTLSNLSSIVDYKLNKYFNISSSIYNEYIVFHTKVRFGYNVNSPINNYKKILKNFFSNFCCSKKIIILGEQKIAQNNDTIAIPSITTIYDELLFLKNNNNIEDLTEEYMYNTPCMEKFEKDLSIISNAICNIGIGHGGQFCINLCFSNKSIYFVEKGLINFKINTDSMILIEDINKFIEKINIFKD